MDFDGDWMYLNDFLRRESWQCNLAWLMAHMRWIFLDLDTIFLTIFGLIKES